MTNKTTNPHAGRKVGATIIDYAIILSFTIWYILTFGEPNDQGGKTVTGWATFVPMLFWFVYLVVVETYYGATLGHRLVGLKVISQDWAKPGFGQVVARRIADVVEISLSFGLIAFILILTTEKNQRLGDLIAKTLVVDKNDTPPNYDFDFEKP